MTALENALKLAGNEDAYVAYLEKKVDDQAQTVADAAAKAAKDERIARAKAIKSAIEDIEVSGDNRIPATYMPKALPTAILEADGVMVKRNAAGMVTSM